MLVKNDKIKLVKTIGNLNKIGEEFTITDIQDGNVSFQCGFGVGVMSYDEFEKHFEKIEEKMITISQKHYDNIMAKSRMYQRFIDKFDDFMEDMMDEIQVSEYEIEDDEDF